MLTLLTLLLGISAFVGAAPTHSLGKRALPRLGGVNLAGCEFGLTIDGTAAGFKCPDTSQIQHFVEKGANLFRLPFGWQYLVGYNQASTTFDEAFSGQYDRLVQASLAAGAYVMVDVHNYARWNGGIIGQGGPTNEQFAALWTKLATRYKSHDRVIFGIMNEPHDLDIVKWGQTVQVAVNAIRATGATTQYIALPGTLFTNPTKWYDGTNDPVLAVTDPSYPDKSRLIIDVHQYLDAGDGGKSRDCAKNGLDLAQPLAAWLKANGRKALVSEIGGGNTPSCHTNLAQYLQYVSTNDAFIGFAAWAAGSFDASYELSITPQNGQDNDLFKLAIQPYLPNKPNGVVTNTAVVPAPSAVATATVLPESQVNLQTFTGTLGGQPAPGVLKAGTAYKSGYKTFTTRLEAVQSSCYTQRDGCVDAANMGGNVAPLNYEGCIAQVNACLALAANSSG